MFDVIPVTSPRPTDCGATCMKMLLSYYGQDADLDELIRECNTSIIGCTGKDLLRGPPLSGGCIPIGWSSAARMKTAKSSSATRIGVGTA